MDIFSRSVPTKERREMDLVGNIRFFPLYIASTVERKGCVRVLCITLRYLPSVLKLLKVK